MIETCKEYINCRGNETIWSQERPDVKQKLNNCIMLNKVYQKTYTAVKHQQTLESDSTFNFSENYIFGKFNAFCGRLGKIISMFDLIDDYSHLFQRRMEGLLMGEGMYMLHIFRCIHFVILEKIIFDKCYVCKKNFD